MTKEEIFKLRDTAEQTRVQFKERVTRDNRYDVSCEMVAQSNYHGGMIVVGIDDKTGQINPLSFQEVQETTNLLGSMASDSVLPQILIETEVVAVDGGNLVVATIKEGLNKPYHDSKGIVWVKQSSDKRRVFDNAELAEMMKNLKEGDGRNKMCEIVEAYARERETRGIAIGETRGKLLEQTNIVTRMLQKGMSETVVADLTGVALSRVKEIALSLA